MFTTIFSHINDRDELKALANEIVKKFNDAYAKRAEELTPEAKKVTAPVQPTPPPTTPPTAAKTAVKATAKTVAKPVARPTAKNVQSVATVAPTPQPKKVVVTPKVEKEEIPQISISDKSALKGLNLTFHKYNDRCWVLIGDTKCIKEDLKNKLHGLPNTYTDRTGNITGTVNKRFYGYIWRNADVPEVAKILGVKVEMAN